MSGSTTLYPHGYGTEKLTLDELKRKHDSRMHPEMSRRFWAWLESMGGLIGIGSGWRTKPHSVSAASREGRSFHQYQNYDSGEFYTALDLVQVNPKPGERHIAPRWENVPVQGTQWSREVGVHMNIGHESWHIQPIELDGFSTWENQGRPDLFVNYPIPGQPVTPPPAGMPPFRPETGEFSLWPLNEHKPRAATKTFVTARVEAGYDNWTYRGDVIRYLQGVIFHKAGGRIAIDGYFGPATEARVKQVQQIFKKEQDGLVGPNTWGIIDYLAGT